MWLVQPSHSNACSPKTATTAAIAAPPRVEGINDDKVGPLADPFGKVIAEASTDQEEILVAECDPMLQEEIRQHWPFLRDRRIDAYGPIVNRWLGTPGTLETLGTPGKPGASGT